jgi:nucleoside triphosphate pyrophosphatase
LLYLASKSPRRKELLKQLGVEFETLSVNIEEAWDGRESAREYVSRLALEKAQAGKVLAKNDLPILASDTEVVLDGKILGKPQNSADAIAMLMSLSGRSHEVYTAVALLHKTEKIAVSVNQVSFKELTEEECRIYSDTGEPEDKAGAYAIQGKAAAFICGLDGSYSSVMGLPLVETAELLRSI